MNHFSAQWQKIQNSWDQQRFPQGLLFVAPAHCDLSGFANRVAKLLLCSSTSQRPCAVCNDCHMLDLLSHPDLEWIKPEKSGSAIKIDQIRDLQNTAYLTPQRAKYRVVVIDGADRMNNSAANALLKILEEPASHTVFILLAQQLATVLPTILSRCQIMRFPSERKDHENNLLQIGEYYALETDQGQIMQQAEQILEDLIALTQGSRHACVIAAQWSKLEFHALVWFLYLVFAQIQTMQFLSVQPKGVAASSLQQLSSILEPQLIFTLLDLINGLLRKLSRNININQTLAVEDFLLILAGWPRRRLG